jgi:hypothetical protein
MKENINHSKMEKRNTRSRGRKKHNIGEKCRGNSGN